MPLPDAAPVFFGKIACFDRATSAAGTIARAKEDTLINPGGHTARAIARALLIVVLAVPLVCGAADADRNAEYARWIEEMKRAERGPFARIRWFCKDGQVLPPESYACKPFGGGSQHGEWSDRTKTLRDAGYYIANFYSDLDVDTFVERHAESGRFAQMLIEQFLIRIDDRWILRQAQFYRGAYQEEGERRGARRLLFKLAERGSWLDHRYLVLRTAARYLKHGPETPSVQEIRQLSASLSEKDPAFKPLRNKIHGTPELADAEAVRAYAAKNTKTAFNEDYARLAGLIESVYTADIRRELQGLARQPAADVVKLAETARAALSANATPPARFRVLAQLLADLRDHTRVPNGPRERIEIIDASLVVESELFTVASALESARDTMTRADRLDVLDANLLAVYGSGLINERELNAARATLANLRGSDSLTAGRYKAALDYLALVPNWGTQRLRQFFGDGMDKLAEIEPKADLFIQDYLRGSPLFFYASLIDALVRDANELAGVRNELFGKDAGAGLRSLNPGLARGVLYSARGQDVAALDANGIFLLPETVSELPPVAGILTEGEGNPLSHVQLLARNLGIPNVGVDQGLVPAVREHDGETVVLAVSPAGSVRLSVDDDSHAAFFAEDVAGSRETTRINVDLEKLDLTTREFLTLSELRADDSGRIVGPKAAKLGELKRHYPDAVAEGLAIPFGAFKAVLDRPMSGTDGTVFEWMQAEYARLAALPRDSEARRRETEAFRAQLQALIESADPGPEFRNRLRQKLHDVFGPDRSYGVFVRSDTNVEDLPGFTGAGLNLTVANVVGVDNILAAIPRVWASPFSARSFAWRQSLMDKPEHVYPAVLLMLSVDAEKSGVLVTRDIDSGDAGWLSVAVNEGVGGAVDGQSAESLRIDVNTGEVRLMASATATVRRQVDLGGGVSKLPVSTRERVLTDAEIGQLITFARELPARFPPIVDAAGEAAPADVEFGFLDGRLRLFQIRPFLDNAETRGNALLRNLDSGLAERADTAVALDEIP